MKKLLTSRKGRKCKQFRCKQILSIYNHELYCHKHSSFRLQDQRSAAQVK